MRERESQYNLRKYKITEISVSNALPIYTHIVEKYPPPYPGSTKTTTPASQAPGSKTNSASSSGPLSPIWKFIKSPSTLSYSIPHSERLRLDLLLPHLLRQRVHPLRVPGSHPPRRLSQNGQVVQRRGLPTL